MGGDISSLGKLPQLVTIDLYQVKRISGDVRAIAFCKNLKTLFLGHTEITGSIESFADLTNIQVRA